MCNFLKFNSLARFSVIITSGIILTQSCFAAGKDLQEEDTVTKAFHTMTFAQAKDLAKRYAQTINGVDAKFHQVGVAPADDEASQAASNIRSKSSDFLDQRAIHAASHADAKKYVRLGYQALKQTIHPIIQRLEAELKSADQIVADKKKKLVSLSTVDTESLAETIAALGKVRQGLNQQFQKAYQQFLTNIEPTVIQKEAVNSGRFLWRMIENSFDIIRALEARAPDSISRTPSVRVHSRFKKILDGEESVTPTTFGDVLAAAEQQLDETSDGDDDVLTELQELREQVENLERERDEWKFKFEQLQQGIAAASAPTHFSSLTASPARSAVLQKPTPVRPAASSKNVQDDEEAASASATLDSAIAVLPPPGLTASTAETDELAQLRSTNAELLHVLTNLKKEKEAWVDKEEQRLMELVHVQSYVMQNHDNVDWHAAQDYARRQIEADKSPITSPQPPAARSASAPVQQQRQSSQVVVRRQPPQPQGKPTTIAKKSSKDDGCSLM